MQQKAIVFAVIFLAIFSGEALFAQAPTSQTPQTGIPSTISKDLGVYAFPAKGQTPETQSKDEFDCFNWAKQETGYDPIAPQAPATPQVQQSKGGMIKGGARGAATGAAIGAIAGDAGKGAEAGAVGGALLGRRAQKIENQQAQEKAQAQAQSASNTQKDQFNKAFSACLEGKGYSVK